VARYAQFLNRQVTVRYRVGEILLSATGNFSADSGRSIFLEQHLEQRGTRKYFRWEIPYPYIYRIDLDEADSGLPSLGHSRISESVFAPGMTEPTPKAAAAAAGENASVATSFSSFPDTSNPLD
jgi:hypothetical protein